MSDLPLIHGITGAGTKASLQCQADGTLDVNVTNDPLSVTFDNNSATAPLAAVSAFGDNVSQRRNVELHASFVYPAASGSMNTDLFDITETNPGAPSSAATVSISAQRELEVFSGVAGSGASGATVAACNTHRRTRYIPGLGLLARFSARFDTPNLATDQLIGLGSDEDAVLIGYSGVVGGDTKFRISRVSYVSGAQVTNPVTQENFNLDTLDGNGPSGMIINPQNGNVFQISLQWLGFGAITFYVENPATGALFPFHTFRYANSNTEPSLSNLNGLSLFAYTLHADLSGSPLPGVTLRTSSMSCMVDGKEPLFGPNRGTSNEKTGVTGTVPVVGLRCAITMPVGSAYANRSEMLLRKITTSKVGGNRGGTFSFILNPTTTTGASWTPYNANTSFAEIDTSATTVSGGETVDIIVVGKEGDATLNLEDYRLEPGDIFYCVFNTTGTSSDALVAINWIDLF